MKAKKNTGGGSGRSPEKRGEQTDSPQKELLEKSRHNPDLGRKPAGKDKKKKTTPPKPAAKSGTAIVRAKEKIPRHQTLDTSGQPRDL